MNDSLGDRMKSYESACEIPLLSMIPTLVRIDGKSFSRLTSKLEKPYNPYFSSVMSRVANILANDTNALLSYNQSDEISLLLFESNYTSQIYFGGKRSKLISVLASLATRHFNNLIGGLTSLGTFDCRVWQVPTKEEAINYFIWRQQDAIRNSIQSAARSIFSHKDCNNKNQSELKEMLLSKGISWDNYPDYYKYGLFYRREYNESKITDVMLEKLPIDSTIKESYSKIDGNIVKRVYKRHTNILCDLEWSKRISFVFGD